MPDLATLAAEPLGTQPAPAALRVERLLPGPIDRVWAYLTEPDRRAKWFAGGVMDLREGGAVAMTFRNSDLSGGLTRDGSPAPADAAHHVMHGVVTRCEPPFHLAFAWEPDGSGTHTTFELKPDGPDTRLVISQIRTPNHDQLISMSAGWHVHVGILVDILSETAPRLFWPNYNRMAEIYKDQLKA